MSETTATKVCPSCGATVPREDRFCAHCGMDFAVSAEEKREINKACYWILAISILFVIAGTIQGIATRSEADKENREIAKYDEHEILIFGNETYTPAELIEYNENQVMFMYGVNYFLAAVMFGLFLWGRKSPFPAMVTALCIYLAVIALNAAIDPATLVQGIIIKVIFIAALIGGIKSSLARRRVRTA